MDWMIKLIVPCLIGLAIGFLIGLISGLVFCAYDYRQKSKEIYLKQLETRRKRLIGEQEDLRKELIVVSRKIVGVDNQIKYWEKEVAKKENDK